MVIHDTKFIKYSLHTSLTYLYILYMSHTNVDILTSPITFVLLMHVADCIIIRYARHVLIIYFVLTSHGNSF